MSMKDLLFLASRYHVKNELDKYYTYFYVTDLDMHCTNIDFDIKLIKIKNKKNESISTRDILHSIYLNEYNNKSSDFMKLIIWYYTNSEIRNKIGTEYNIDFWSDSEIFEIVDKYFVKEYIIKTLIFLSSGSDKYLYIEKLIKIDKNLLKKVNINNSIIN